MPSSLMHTSCNGI
uniref:Uncharacterized protein n=1 Tax=Anguilla anguilla TaxID=7936 RepID=A0A0E9PHP8_ANGAN